MEEARGLVAARAGQGAIEIAEVIERARRALDALPSLTRDMTEYVAKITHAIESEFHCDLNAVREVLCTLIRGASEEAMEKLREFLRDLMRLTERSKRGACMAL